MRRYTHYTGSLIIGLSLLLVFYVTLSFATQSNAHRDAVIMTVASDASAPNVLPFPEPNPPRIDLGEVERVPPDAVSPKSLPTAEWTYHKTSDNAHPDGNEQQLIWLMNRARANPTEEGVWLATVDDSNIAYARLYFDVDLEILQEEFAGYDAKPPAAFDRRLYEAAKAHSEDLISRDAQDHDGQFDRISDAGFSYTTARGNVFSYSLDALYGHAGFNIDWGSGDGTGMQPGRGHRMAIMSIDGDYTNVGIAAVQESDPATRVGPLVITGDFCKANTYADDHHNRFLVGTVWEDLNGNSLYDPGEGVGGVTVMPDQGTYYAVTATSGGYAVPMLSSGNYQVTFSGSNLPAEVVESVTVGNTSVLLDLTVDSNDGSNDSVPEVSTGAATSVTATSAILNGTINPNSDSATYYFEYGTTDNYGLNSASSQADSEISVMVSLSNLSANTTYHYRLAGINDAGTTYGDDRTFTTLPASDGAVETLVEEYYNDILDREPDESGADSWKTDIERMVTLSVDVKEGFIALAKVFFISTEYTLQDKNDSQYVTDLYQTFLDRTPAQAEIDAWVAYLEQGLSRNVVLNSFAFSEEFRLYMENMFGEDVSLPECNLVNDFYRGLQGRLPDTDGFYGWVELMRDAMSTGEQAVRDLAYQIALGFLESQEYTQQNKTDREFLEDLYNGILRRGAEQSEFDAWIAIMNAGQSREDVLQQFTDSEEFQLRVQAIIDAAGLQ